MQIAAGWGSQRTGPTVMTVRICSTTFRTENPPPNDQSRRLAAPGRRTSVLLRESDPQRHRQADHAQPQELVSEPRLNRLLYRTAPSVRSVRGAQNGIFCRVAHLLANARRSSAVRNDGHRMSMSEVVCAAVSGPLHAARCHKRKQIVRSRRSGELRSRVRGGDRRARGR
jgi:hypothetical protein